MRARSLSRLRFILAGFGFNLTNMLPLFVATHPTDG
jgi:hypothetical protein